MYTLSFLSTKNGYAAAMNRDELFSRATALPPQKFNSMGTEAIYPREPGGGTWMACNGHGNLLALPNRNVAGAGKIAGKLKSRGEIIPLLIGGHDFLSTEMRFDSLPLEGTFPFRLIGIFRRQHMRSGNGTGTVFAQGCNSCRGAETIGFLPVFPIALPKSSAARSVASRPRLRTGKK